MSLVEERHYRRWESMKWFDRRERELRCSNGSLKLEQAVEK